MYLFSAKNTIFMKKISRKCAVSRNTKHKTTPPCRKFSKFPFLPPETKLWEGNVFTPVCQSFCSWGSLCPSLQLRSHDRGSLSRGVSVQWGLCPGGYLSRGSLSSGSLSGRPLGQRPSHTVMCRGMHSYFMKFYNGSLWENIFRDIHK